MTTSSRADAPRRRPLTELMDRQPPFDLQAEIGVLGSIVLLPDVLDNVALILRPTDFYDDAHRKLFTHMSAMHESGRKFDDTLLINRLKTAGEYEGIGGAAYLSKIVNAVPNAAHANYYAEIVRAHAEQRELIYATTVALQQAYDQLPAEDIAAELEGKLIARHRGSDLHASPISEVWGRVIDGLQKRVGKPDPPAMLSGLEVADRIGFVFVPGELTILAARPGVGKTSMATQIARHHARKNRCVLFASLEMADEALASRVLMAKAGINFQSVRTSGIDQQTVDDLRTAREEFGDVPLYIWAPGRVKVAAIRAMATAFKSRHDLKLLIIDYTSWIFPDDPRAQKREQVGEIIKALRSIGQRLEVPVLLLHQLNREGERERPQLSHLRDSGCAEEDADIVAFLDPVETAPGAQSQVTLIVAKNRQGSRGEAPLFWHPQTTTFTDPESF